MVDRGRGDESHTSWVDWVAGLKHDLAKYVAWRSANFEDEVWEGPLRAELVAALQADILRTHRDRPAWELWDERRAELNPPRVHPALVEIEDAVAVLRSCKGALEDGEGPALAAMRPQIRAAQQSIRAALQRLHREVRQG